MSLYVCSSGHLVKADASAVNIDSRCGRCKANRRRAQLRARGLRPVRELAATRPHGDRLRYLAGCRCAECRRANCAYEKVRYRARKAGDWNGIVDAGPARKHILALRRRGLGRGAIAAATDIPQGQIRLIAAGKKRRIRARSDRKILAVTAGMICDGALVPASRLWQRIGELIEEGYSKSFLARELGYKGRGLQFNRNLVTARNAENVERLYRRLTA